MEQTESHKPRVSRLDLFLTFSRISLSSFGGAIFWARRQLIDRQRWLTEREFVDVLTLGQLLPGPNVLNLTVMVGYRFAGWTGAAGNNSSLSTNSSRFGRKHLPKYDRSRARPTLPHEHTLGSLIRLCQRLGDHFAGCYRERLHHAPSVPIRAVLTSCAVFSPSSRTV